MSKKKQREQQAPAEGPPDDFCEWWNPSGLQKPSGASVGGHPDSERTWARKDSHGWTRRVYGINAAMAWLAQPFRNEYNAWVAAGRPERTQDFVSLALPVPEQVEKWKELREVLSRIAKPVGRARGRDYDKGKAPHVEPIDERRAQLEDGNTIEGEFTKVENGAIDFDKREVSDE